MDVVIGYKGANASTLEYELISSSHFILKKCRQNLSQTAQLVSSCQKVSAQKPKNPEL
jgi:hypothetical protein